MMHNKSGGPDRKPATVAMRLLAGSLAVNKRPSLLNQEVDTWYHNRRLIRNVKDFVEHMQAKGLVRVKRNEMHTVFNRMVNTSPTAFGADVVAEVLCFDVPSVDSLFCTICSVWESVEGMLEHMQSFQHYDTYVLENYPSFHKAGDGKPQEEREDTIRRYVKLLKNQKEGGDMHLRMSTLIDLRTIKRLFPRWFQQMQQDEDAKRARRTTPGDTEVIVLSSDSDEEEPKRRKKSTLVKTEVITLSSDSDEEEPERRKQSTSVKTEVITLSSDSDEEEPRRRKRSRRVCRSGCHQEDVYKFNTQHNLLGEPRHFNHPDDVRMFQQFIDEAETGHRKELRLKLLDVFFKLAPKVARSEFLPPEEIDEAFLQYGIDPVEGCLEHQIMNETFERINAVRLEKQKQRRQQQPGSSSSGNQDNW